MSNRYWTLLLNQHPKLTKVEINVKTKKIIISASDLWNQKTDAKIAHIYTPPPGGGPLQ